MDSVINDKYAIYKGDCIHVMQSIPDKSIDYSVFSPPFAGLYLYSDSPQDMSNCEDDDQFFDHYRYLARELKRVIKDGRLVSVHCMNLPTSKQHDGHIGLRDFRGDVIRAMQDEGFIFASEVCVWKNPVVAMQRTKAYGLLHKTIRSNATYCRQGIPDYVVTFRNGEIPDKDSRVAHSDLPVDEWQELASPVWMDIDQGNVLPYRGARDEKDEKHISPLQLDVIKRCVRLWTNEGDTVFTPFMGVGSEVYTAVEMGRKGIGIELKDSYFDQAVRNLDALTSQTSLFGDDG